MTHESTNGDAATAKLMRTVIIVLVIAVTGVTMVSIFTKETSQPAALSMIEKLLAPILTALVGFAITEIAKVKHIVNSKSDKQDAKIADLEKQISEGRQSKVDTQQAKVAEQQAKRSEMLDERDAKADAKAAVDTAVKAAVDAVKPEMPSKVSIEGPVVITPATKEST